MTGRVHDEALTLAAYAILNEPGDQARNYREALRLFEHAERLGIEGLWVRQFHLRRPQPGGGLPSPFVFLAWLAARTTRLRLGTAAVTLPLESPLRVAEDAAVLDALSGGRTELGVANGGAAAGLAELFRGGSAGGAGDAAGAGNPDLRRAEYLTDLARLAGALDGAALDDAGARLNPPSPGLSDRIWEATLTERSGYETGTRGHGVLIGTTQSVPAEVTARAYLRGLEQYTERTGRRRPPRLGLATLIYPAKDRESALREARAGIEEKYEWGRTFLPPASTLAEKAASICLHYGTAEQIAESIAAQPWFPYATQLMVQTELFYASYAQRGDALELFTRDVAPALGWAGAAQGVPAGPRG